MSVSDRPVAIVSGASGGIGGACARSLAAAGLDVAINYRSNEAGATETLHACEALGADAVAVKGDVGHDDDCRALAGSAFNRWGRIDVLVNNAGTTRFAEPGDMDALSADDFAAVFATNVTGAWQLTRACREALEASGTGAVVNVSSYSAMSGLGSSAAYTASKGALNTLTLSLARALAPAVRVNAVCPGYVDTDWLRGAKKDAEMDDFRRRAEAISPLEHLVSADEVAEAVRWFALDARAITGQLLVIDSGTHLTVANPAHADI